MVLNTDTIKNLPKYKMSADKKRCRACLCYGKHSYNLESSEVLEIFIHCISLPISINDFLPKALCNKCYKLLIKFDEFKRLCSNSEKILSDEKKCLVTKEQHELSKISNYNPEIEIKLEESLIEIDTMKQEFDDSTANENPDFDHDLIGFDDNSSETSLNTEINHDIKNEKKSLIKADLKKKRASIIKAYIDTKKKCISKISKRKDSDEEFIPYPKNTKYKKTKPEIDVECCICNSKFKSKRALWAHEAADHKIEVENKCKICNLEFKTLRNLKKHIRKHANHPIACPTCGKVLTRPGYMPLHMKKHLRLATKQSYICHICAKSFKSRKYLDEHVKIHENNRVRTHECEICKKKYFSLITLKSHKSSCHKPWTIACKICGVLVGSNKSLKSHMMVHSDVKPYVCNFCNKAFPRKCYFMIHTRIHTGERPFSCDVCGQKCISKIRLIEHQRTHTGEKPFKCKICNHAFSQMGTMKRHFNLHKSQDSAVSV